MATTEAIEYMKRRYADKYANIIQNLTQDNICDHITDILNILGISAGLNFICTETTYFILNNKLRSKMTFDVHQYIVYKNIFRYSVITKKPFNVKHIQSMAEIFKNLHSSTLYNISLILWFLYKDRETRYPHKFCEYINMSSNMISAGNFNLHEIYKNVSFSITTDYIKDTDAIKAALIKIYRPTVPQAFPSAPAFTEIEAANTLPIAEITHFTPIAVNPEKIKN